MAIYDYNGNLLKDVLIGDAVWNGVSNYNDKCVFVSDNWAPFIVNVQGENITFTKSTFENSNITPVRVKIDKNSFLFHLEGDYNKIIL